MSFLLTFSSVRLVHFMILESEYGWLNHLIIWSMSWGKESWYKRFWNFLVNTRQCCYDPIGAKKAEGRVRYIARQANQSTLYFCSFVNQCLHLLLYKYAHMNIVIYKKWDRDAVRSGFMIKTFLILPIP